MDSEIWITVSSSCFGKVNVAKILTWWGKTMNLAFKTGSWKKRYTRGTWHHFVGVLLPAKSHLCLWKILHTIHVVHHWVTAVKPPISLSQDSIKHTTHTTDVFAKGSYCSHAAQRTFPWSQETCLQTQKKMYLLLPLTPIPNRLLSKVCYIQKHALYFSLHP